MNKTIFQYCGLLLIIYNYIFLFVDGQSFSTTQHNFISRVDFSPACIAWLTVYSIEAVAILTLNALKTDHLPEIA